MQKGFKNCFVDRCGGSKSFVNFFYCENAFLTTLLWQSNATKEIHKFPCHCYKTGFIIK
jgi:hypothetical protein